MIDERRLQETIDRSEIANLLSKSILARDSGWWDVLAGCYHSKAELNSSWWEGKPSDFFRAAGEKLAASQREGGEQKHLTGNLWIEINGDRAVAENDLILFMRSLINDVELDIATSSRRVLSFAKENGEWKILKQWIIYERDRMDPVDPTVPVDKYYDPKALSKYPKKLQHHLWRNEIQGSAPAKELCLRGTDQEKAIREAAQSWLQGK